MDKKKRAKKIAQEVKNYVDGKSIENCATSLLINRKSFASILQRLRDRNNVDVPYKQEPKETDIMVLVEKEYLILE